jgi:hypothetical protein
MLKRKRKEILTILLAIVILIGVAPFGAYADTSLEEIDKIKPVINYSYVQNGWLVLSISDNYALARKPIEYRIDKELRTYEMDLTDYYYEYDGNKRIGMVYEIKVEIPSTIGITIKDLAGNESTYSFSIKEDNVGLTKYIPEFILERLADNRQSRVDRFKGYGNIFELEYGKVVNALSLYKEVITDHYKSYDKNDIKFRINGLTSDKEGNIKLDKYGIFKVTMTHSKDKTFEETAYMLIKPNWKNTEKRKVPSNVSPYIVYSDKIKVADYFRYEDEVNQGKGKSKIDTSYMLVYDTESEKTYEMTDPIILELNKIYKLSVLNFENNSDQDFYIMRQEKVKSKSKAFTDVNKDYWANKDIGILVSKGLLSGYPDGTFNPTGNITIKEFMAILSRQIAMTPAKANPVVGNVILPINASSWGYIESKSILDRVPGSDLRRFNYMNIDRPINREEVAFLLTNALEMGIAYNANINKPLTDISMSAYPSEVTKLVDLGFISGYPDGTFRAKDNIKRAEIATLFARIK